MAEEPRQYKTDVRQDNLLHKAWVHLTTALGSRLAVVLAVFALALIVLLILSFIWYLIPIFVDSELTLTQRKTW